MAESAENPNNSPELQPAKNKKCPDTLIVPLLEEQLRDRVGHLLERLPEVQSELADRCRDHEIWKRFHSNENASDAAASEDKPAGYVDGNEKYRRQEITYRKFWDLHCDAQRAFDLAVALSEPAIEIGNAFVEGTWRTSQFGMPPSLVEDQCTKTHLYLQRLYRILSPNQSEAQQPAPAATASTLSHSPTDAELKKERRALRDVYKSECKQYGKRVTDEMIAEAATSTWHNRTAIQKWLACDPRYNGEPDRLIRNVFARKPHLLPKS